MGIIVYTPLVGIYPVDQPMYLSWNTNGTDNQTLCNTVDVTLTPDSGETTVSTFKTGFPNRIDVHFYWALVGKPRPNGHARRMPDPRVLRRRQPRQLRAV